MFRWRTLVCGGLLVLSSLVAGSSSHAQTTCENMALRGTDGRITEVYSCQDSDGVWRPAQPPSRTIKNSKTATGPFGAGLHEDLTVTLSLQCPGGGQVQTSILLSDHWRTKAELDTAFRAAEAGTSCFASADVKVAYAKLMKVAQENDATFPGVVRYALSGEAGQDAQRLTPQQPAQTSASRSPETTVQKQLETSILYAAFSNHKRGNFAVAFKLFQHLAQLGIPTAQNKLGTMYENGDGVPKDAAEAVHWYRLAAQQGSHQAQHNLGLAYSKGNGVPQEFAKAVHWYRLAAQQGFAASQAQLGKAYLLGEGVPVDLTEGKRLLRLAARQGDEAAQNGLRVLGDSGYLDR